MLQLQSAFGIVALLAIAWALRREPPRGLAASRRRSGLSSTLVTAVILIKLPFVAHAFGAINDAVGAIAAASRAGTSFVFGYLGGGAAAVRPEGARRGFHPGVPGAADRAGHERADDAAVLLARAAADRARHGLAARAHARRRRRGRAVDRRQHLPRHGRSAAVRAALSGADDAQRIVPGHDRRHGRHRRHRAGALRDAAGAADPRCRRAFRHRLRARRAGRDPGQPDHGAGDDGRSAPAARSTIPTCKRPSTMDAIVKGTTAGLELLLNIVAMLLVLVALVYLANADPRPAAGDRRREDLAAADAGLSSWRRCAG